MTQPNLEEVYKLSGVPTYTFVKPVEYQKLLISLRTPGRGLVIEGPSGIGKTTSVSKALEYLGLAEQALKLTTRKKEDRKLIADLPEMTGIGTVIVDDFHRLDEDTKQAIADFMKTLADEEDKSSKLVVLGINKAGDSLIKFAKDLNNRLDIIRFEVNPEERVLELIKKGEQALKVNINIKEEIAKNAQGSFHIAQLLCHETCLLGGVTEGSESEQSLTVSFEVVRERVLEELSRAFFEVARRFATGPRLRREGRAPYLHMLHWLATDNEWSLNLDQALARHPDHKASVGQVVEKRLLDTFISQNDEFAEVLHYDPNTRVLSVEDPKFVYFMRNLLWSKFAKQVGFLSMDFKCHYDFALSFAGADRSIAKAIMNKLTEWEIAVFYDKNEQHRILAENVEEYLGPIYRSEAQFVVALLGSEYPKRIWTKFESEQFRTRFGESSVIPVWFKDAPPGMFDETNRVGGLSYDRDKDTESQVSYIAETLIKKLAEVRGLETHKQLSMGL